jgi:hypothetical protein
MAFLSFQLPPGSYDINITPDKRTVFMQQEVSIMNALQEVNIGGVGRGRRIRRLVHWGL